MRAAVLLLFAVAVLADQHPDVRKVTLGMSLDQVRATETASPLSTVQKDGETVLSYATDDLIPGATSIQYAFRNNVLARATYVFSLQHSDPNGFVADFHTIESKLRPTLKAVTCERAIWLDDSLQNERLAYLNQDRRLPSDILPSDVDAGLSVSLGHLQLVSVWATPRMQIVHAMTGANRKILHTVEYRALPGDKSDLAEACQGPR